MLVSLESEQLQARADADARRAAGAWEWGAGRMGSKLLETETVSPTCLACTLSLNLLNYGSSVDKPSFRKGSQEQALAANALIRSREKLFRHLSLKRHHPASNLLIMR